MAGVLRDAPRRVLPDPGEVLLREGLAHEAIPFLKRSHDKEPSVWRHLSNLGVAHRITGEFSLAKDYLKQALRLSPEAPEIWLNFGVLLDDLGDFGDALQAYQKAFQRLPANQTVAFNYAASLLRHGRWQDAWPLWEFGRYNRSYQIPLEAKIWEGQNLFGKRILILKEGGNGDTFLFMRYFKKLRDMGAEVTFYVWDNQVGIVEKSGLADKVLLGSTGVNLQDFDYLLPIMSLPAILREEMDKPWREGRYIKSDFVAGISLHGRANVGICWQAEENGTARKFRSLPDESLEPLKDLDVSWLSLQKGRCLEWMTDPKTDGWEETASLIDSLDWVISADTAVANLAGAMNKPVWILLPLNAEWKWGIGREDSPVYPSAKLFRNKDPLDWKELIERVASEVGEA